MKRTVEIEDNLSEIIDSVDYDLDEACKAYLEEYPDTQSLDDWQPHESIFEIADSATPIYTSEIDGLHYLYGEEFEEAYRNAGIGTGDETNHDAVAIMCYIEEKMWEHYHDLTNNFDEWRTDNPDAPATEFNPKE